MKHLVVAFILLAGMLSDGAFVYADVAVRPLIVDRTIAPRDLLTETVTLTNTSDRRLVVYATVNEISIHQGGDIREFISPDETDRTNSIMSWIEVNRGRIELAAGESVEIPITIRVHPFAKEGEYHAFIGFVPASKRYQAEAVAMAGEATGVVLRFDIPDQRQEVLRISRFIVDRLITGETGHEASITLENLGDIDAMPTGEIIFYDSKGSEIDSVKINLGQEIVPAGGSVTFLERVPMQSSIGRYKANLSLSYGLLQRAQLSDTAFFYIFPLQTVLAIFVGVLVFTLLLVLLIRRLFTPAVLAQEGDDVPLYVRQGQTDHNSTDYDIDLKQPSQK